MKKLFLAFALVACFAVSALCQGSPPWTIQEIDGNPRVNSPTLIKVTNGTLSCTGKTCTITISGGGGGSPGGSNTQVQYNAAGSFGGISGFTSDGTNVTAGSGNLRATRPRFITSIDDTNGNEVFVITATGSAVNEVTIANAATGNNPTFTASGGDANVGINFVPKGSGTIQVSGAAIVTVSATQTLTNKTLTTPIIAQISNTGTLTLPTSTDTLVGRATTDTLTNKTLSTSNTVSAALTWTAGVKQTFAPDATTAGLNVGSVAGDPSVPANGDLWYDSTANELTARINGANVALGSGGGGGITIGTTTITSGTNTRVLYNNAGVVGEYVITGTGNVMMSASPTTTGRLTAADANFATAVTTGTGATAGFQITANNLTTGNGHEISSSSVSSGNVVRIAATGTAAASNTKTALNVATSGANGTSTQTTYGVQISNTSTGTSSTNIGLSVSASGGTNNTAINVGAGQILVPNGTASLPSYSFTSSATSGIIWNAAGFPSVVVSGTNAYGFSAGSLILNSTYTYSISPSGPTSGGDVFLGRAGAANWRMGNTDAASPVAQTLSVQNVVGGTTNTAGVNWTFAASRGTGTGAGGDIIFQTAPAGGSGTTQNTLATAFTIQDDGAVQLKSVTFANLPTVANGYLIYCSDCTIASPCASGGSGALAKGINGAWVCN